MKLPMREKYVDEAIGIYCVFSTHADGTVDVSDGNRDVFNGLPRDVADKVVAAHDAFSKELYKLLCEGL